jgi:ectoine hydroxylase-related dioxygenase (phytanoyl-CoA dioxygenase family)
LFSYVLEPQKPDDGGLALLPGSHKSNTSIGIHVFSELMNRDFHASPWIFRPNLNAGDLLIFTEATMHGTEVWRPMDRRRRNIYYKYCYGFMGWPPADNDESVYLREHARNEQEQLLVRPPFVSETTGNELKWRRETLLGEPPSAIARGKNLIARGLKKLG